MLLEAKAWLNPGDPRFTHLFPETSLPVAAHAVMSERDWTMCAKLYGHTLRCGLQTGALTPKEVLSLSAANARLVDTLWPASCTDLLRIALDEVVAYARRFTGTRQALAVHRSVVTEVRDALERQAPHGASLRSVEAAAAVMRAATNAHSRANLVRAAVQVVTWAESAAVDCVPPSSDRASDLANARLEVWHPAFLFLDLALS